jgi:hypothetical protein
MEEGNSPPPTIDGGEKIPLKTPPKKLFFLCHPERSEGSPLFNGGGKVPSSNSTQKRLYAFGEKLGRGTLPLPTDLSSRGA